MGIKLRHWKLTAVLLAVCITPAVESSAATLQPKTLQGWDAYVQSTEKRVNQELSAGGAFLVLEFKPPEDQARVQKILHEGDVYAERVKTRDERGREIHVQDGIIHHWYGSILIPNATLAEVIHWVQDYDHHADYFPEVEKSRLLRHDGDSFKIFLRLVRKKVVTVHYNTEHSVTYRTHSGTRVSSRSIADRIAELSNPGERNETEKTSADDSGFLWRLNSYWRFEETDEGVIVECESISLSRSIPFGLGWLIGPFVESVPRESLQSMLTSIREGVTYRMSSLQP